MSIPRGSQELKCVKSMLGARWKGMTTPHGETALFFSFHIYLYAFSYPALQTFMCLRCVCVCVTPSPKQPFSFLGRLAINSARHATQLFSSVSAGA